MSEDLALVAYSDPRANLKINWSNLSVKNLLYLCEINKISCENLPLFLMVESRFFDSNAMRNVNIYANRHRKFRYNWLLLIDYISKLLMEKDVAHSFIKVHRHPLALMSDIDVLFPTTKDIYKALNILRRAGFRVKKDLLSHPLRFIAQWHYISPQLDVEFYPDGIWHRRRICNGSDIISRRQSTRIGDAIIYTPAPEDDLYLVAIHAYYDLQITLGEILHGIQILRKYNYSFSWKRLIKLAYTYGTVDGLYYYLMVINHYYRRFHDNGYPLVPNKIISLLENFPACGAIRDWYVKKGLNLSFPVAVPYSFGRLHSCINYYRTNFKLRQTSLSDLMYDIASQIIHLPHYLSVRIACH